MDIEVMYEVIVLAMATSAISITTSKAKVFASLREWIVERSKWFGELVSCHYCTSHWVSLGFVALYRPVLVELWYPLDLIVSVFVVVALSALVSGAILRLTPK